MEPETKTMTMTMTKEEIEKMRRDLSLPPTCPKCGHSNWTYKKGPSSWACQKHGWLT